MKYKILAKDGRAKRADVETVHGTIHTPVFMNVGTVAAIKGAVSTDDLRGIGTQVELSNTYHLHVRTGDKLIKELGGLHRFMNWDRPILTDSGGFQVFSERSRKRASTSTPTSMVIRSSWDRRRACRSSQTLVPPSRWHSMSALRIRVPENTWRILSRELQDGWRDVRRRWRD